MQVGDRVMFSRAFCRSTGLYASNDPLVHRSKGGEITSLSGDPKRSGAFATIRDANGDTRKALVSNLALTTAREIE